MAYLTGGNVPEVFDKYLQIVFWDQPPEKHCTGYVDPGGIRTTLVPSEAQLIDNSGLKHLYAHHNL